MRTIDADELKKMFPDKGEGAWTYNITAKAYIDAQPTVDLWKYPSKGEYPKEGEEVLCWYEPKIKVVAQYYTSDDIWFCDALLSGHTPPLCWQYIVPPKEEE